MVRRAGRLTALASALALGMLPVLAGCGQSGAARSTRLPAGRTFVSTSVTDGGGHQRPLVRATKISLTFQAGTISANAGCNTISGAARLDAGRLVVGALATTAIGCPQPLADQDTWLANFLTSRPALTLQGPTLTLHGSTAILTLTDRKVAEPDRPLAGTHWVADTVIDRNTASSVPPATANLILTTDGHVSGNTGCRGFSGSYTATATTVTFSSLGTGKRSCASDTVRMDRAVLAALTGTVTYHIDAGRLTLTAASGAGLGLTAR
jgi:heat shock protein HslJ